MEYKIELETFRGPLDLLLFLVKRDEIDIFDIPIARVTEQFLAYLNLLQLIDVEWAGDFLIMAATLMEIKSRMLLPREEEMAAEEDDPRLELVKQLIEYKKFKEAAALLEEKAEQQLTRLPRQPFELVPDNAASQPLRKVEIWDLVSAFGRLVRETLALRTTPIVIDETPLQVHMDNILNQLDRAQTLPFTELFTVPHHRGRLLGMFLAILELIKGRFIEVEQPELFGEIWVRLREKEPETIEIETGGSFDPPA